MCLPDFIEIRQIPKENALIGYIKEGKEK